MTPEPDESIVHSRAPFTSLTLDAGGTIVAVGPDYEDVMGVSPDTVVGRSFVDFIAHQADLDQVRAVLADARDDAGYARLTLRHHQRVALKHVIVTWAALPDGGLRVVLADETDAISRYFELRRAGRRDASMARNSADVMWLFTPDGRVAYVTSALSTHLGWTEEEVLEHPGIPFVHPDDAEEAYAAYRSVRDRVVSQCELEVRMLHADGTSIWTRTSLTDLRDDPAVGAIMGSAVDITDKKDEEARRAREEAQYRSQFEQSLVPQSFTDLALRYRDVNEAYCQLLGRSREELLALRPDDLLHPDDPGTGGTELAEMVAGLRDAGPVFRVFTHADGSPVPVLVSGTVIRDGDGTQVGFSAIIQDQRELQASEQRRVELQGLFETIAERGDELLKIITPDGRIAYSSPNGPRLLGYRGHGLHDPRPGYVHPDDRDRVEQAWHEVVSGTSTVTLRFRAFRDDGARIWIEQTATNLTDTPIGGIVCTMRDVTREVDAQQALESSETRHRMIADLAEEGIWVLARDGRTLYANARLAALVGYSLETLYSAPVWDFMDAETAALTIRRLTERELRGPERYEVPYLHPDGTLRRLWIAASPMRDETGTVEGSLAMVSDVTDTRRIEAELRHAALHDALTGLPNRSLLVDRLGQALLEDDGHVAVLFADLDLFKDVNDARGHGVGDEILVSVAHRLASIVGVRDTVARFGGDEFVLILRDVDESDARAVAARALEALTAPFDVDDLELSIGCSIGLAMSAAAVSSEDLLRHADAAMYAAKTEGRGRIRVFESGMEDRTRERHVLGSDLRAALGDGGLDMEYQPIVDLTSGRVLGVEALSRWHHPEQGTVPAPRFIGLAESLGLAPKFDRWALDRAFRDAARMRRERVLPHDAYVAVNLSGRSLADETLDRYVIERAEHHGLDPQRVVLELTESAIMADPEVAIGLLQRLRARQFHLAVDDFGTGYSSLAYLRDLPVTMLKIDRSFVAGITDDQHSLAIVSSVLQLARTLQLGLVAEGVETDEHARILREHGCRLGQGWLWSKAVTPETARRERTFARTYDAPDPLHR